MRKTTLCLANGKPEDVGRPAVAVFFHVRVGSVAGSVRGAILTV
jgi:hypothetical protein